VTSLSDGRGRACPKLVRTGNKVTPFHVAQRQLREYLQGERCGQVGRGGVKETLPSDERLPQESVLGDVGTR
jgi:hypothetical protein